MALCAVQYPSDDEDGDDDDDDTDYIDTDSLGDWRNFRRSLTLGMEVEENQDDGNNTKNSVSSTKVSVKDDDDVDALPSKRPPTKSGLSVKSVSKDNEEVLKSQNKDLAEEYLNGVWAHETSTVSWLLEDCGNYRVPLSFTHFS